MHSFPLLLKTFQRKNKILKAEKPRPEFLFSYKAHPEVKDFGEIITELPQNYFNTMIKNSEYSCNNHQH